MPQLNPDPWLSIFVLTWTVFLIVLPPKVMAHTFPKEPTLQGTEKPPTSSWAWPWH